MQINTKKVIELVIFWSKWILIPFYLRLIWTLVVLLWHFFPDGHINNDHLMQTLQAVDIVMVANLVKMIITGSYNSFVSKTHGEEGEKASSGLLKVKMATSVMGVSSIHLLQTFISAETIEWAIINKQLAIHGIFIVGALILAYIDFLHVKSETLEHATLDNHN